MKKEKATETKPVEEMKVTFALLHQAIHWPQSKLNSERSFNTTKFPGLEMLILSYGLLLKHDGKVCIIPFANVANLVLE